MGQAASVTSAQSPTPTGALRQRLMDDPRSPAETRTPVPRASSVAYAAAFDPRSPMPFGHVSGYARTPLPSQFHQSQPQPQSLPVEMAVSAAPEAPMTPVRTAAEVAHSATPPKNINLLCSFEDAVPSPPRSAPVKQCSGVNESNDASPKARSPRSPLRALNNGSAGSQQKRAKPSNSSLRTSAGQVTRPVNVGIY